MPVATDFYRWTGLPHVVGADPRDGEGACCLKVAQVIHQELGLPFPTEQVEIWLSLARARQWARLRAAFIDNTVPAANCRPGTMAQVNRSDGTFGIATAVDDRYLLVPVHDRGLAAVPKRVFRQFHEVRR